MSRPNPDTWKRFRQEVVRLSEDERGLVSQVDFLTSMVIRIVAFGLLLAVASALIHNAVATDYTDRAVASALIHNAVATDYTDRAVAERSAARLADDLLVTSPGRAVLNATCTEEFFQASTEVCEFDEDWVDGRASYLNAALAVSETKRLNVTITDSSGALATMDSTTLAIGDPPPARSGTVQTWQRQVGLDTTDDGSVGWYKLTVSVWE